MGSVTHFDIWKDTNPEYRIKDLINYLKYVGTTLEETTCENIVERLCNDGKTYASLLNQVAPSGGTEKSTVEKYVSGTSGQIYLSGPNAVYDEFGTGEEGALNPHPMKDMFGLNPYNSGSFVSSHTDIYGQHFWFYSPMKGHPYFNEKGLTYGIPSGKQMYNTLNYIYEIKDNITKEEINKALQVLK